MDEEKKRRPERVHYVAKKHDVTDTTNKEAEEGTDYQGTGTKTRKKKKNKARVKDNKSNEATVENVTKYDKKESGKHESSKNYQEQQKGEKSKDESNANKTKRNEIQNTQREPTKKVRDSVDDIPFNKSTNEDKRHESTRSLHREAAAGFKYGNRKSMYQENWQQSSSTKHEEYSTKSLPWRRNNGDGEFGGGTARFGRGGARRNSPNSRGWWRETSSRHSSPRRWSRPGSRTSSPRSSRGNSPQRYKQNSRRSSFDHRQGHLGKQIYTNKNYEYKSSRAKKSRTPSPKLKGSSHKDSRDEVEFNIRQSKPQPKDSRDLTGWTRNDTRRRPESLSFSDNKPPSGRIKSAPSNSFNVKDDSKASTREEPVRSNRKESESLYSDWSQEIEDEEERSLSMEPPPTMLPAAGESLCGRGVLRLVPEDSVPPPSASIITTPISSTTLTTNSWAYTDNTRNIFIFYIQMYL